MPIVGVIMLLFLVVAGIASVGGLIYIWVRALSRPVVNQGLPLCGRCGYAVRGVGSLACPECGADFREVGIVTPAMRRRYIGPVLFIAIWSLALWMPGCTISGILIAVGPQKQIPHEDAYLVPKDPVAAGYDTVDLRRSPYDMYGDWLDFGVPGNGDYMDVDIYGSNNAWVSVDLTNNTYRDYNASHNAPAKPFDRAAVEGWLGYAGADLTNPDVQQQADELYQTISQTRANGLGTGASPQFTSTSHSAWTDTAPAPWFSISQVVFWPLVYVGGLFLYFWLRRRHQAASQRLTAEANAAAQPATAAPAPADTAQPEAVDPYQHD